MPVAQEMSLGWIQSGRAIVPLETDENNRVINSMRISCEENLDKNLRSFWEVEELPQKSFISDDDKRCEEIFTSTTTRNADSRYCVEIPLKTDLPMIGDFYQVARKCLSRLEARLSKNAALSKDYNDFLGEYLALCHMAP